METSLRPNLISRYAAVVHHKINRGAMALIRVAALALPKVLILSSAIHMYRRRVIFALISGLFLYLLGIPAQAAQTQQAECQIGSSSSCPALSAQEVYSLYGNTSDSSIWISGDGTTSGTATQIFALMNHGATNNSGWLLLMKGTKGTSNFGYTSSPFTSSSYTLNPTSLTNDTTTDAVFSAYGTYPVSNAVVAFSNPTYGSTVNGGDIASNIWGAWVWNQSFTSQTMYTRLTTNTDIYTDAYTNVRTALYMNGANNYFSYQNGYARYGFNISPCKSARWGIVWNNETSWSSCDDSVGLGLSDGSPGDIPSWPGVSAAYGQTNANGANGGLGPMAFQLWGRKVDPAFGTPQTLTSSTPNANQVNLNWSAPASGTVAEYVVQYKKNSAPDWSAANTFRITTPTASPSAAVSGLDQGTTYNFRIWARSSSDSSATPLTGSVTTPSATVASVTLNTANPIYRTPSTLTASVNAVGRATFYAQGKVIPGCKNLLTTISTVTCTWTPSFHAVVNIQVTYAPSAAPSQTSRSSMNILVAARAAGSKKR
jgi:hypothetical protein